MTTSWCGRLVECARVYSDALAHPLAHVGGLYTPIYAQNSPPAAARVRYKSRYQTYLLGQKLVL